MCLTGSGRSASEAEESAILEENRQLLQLLARYIVEENNPVPEEVSLTLLGCLVPQGNALLSPNSEGMAFAELMSILSTLASAGSGVGHVQLFRAATEWLAICRYPLREAWLTGSVRAYHPAAPGSILGTGNPEFSDN